MALTRIPIVIYYGDFIPKAESDNPHTDYWRAAVKMAREFAACINRHGGHAEVIELPDVGIHRKQLPRKPPNLFGGGAGHFSVNNKNM